MKSFSPLSPDYSSIVRELDEFKTLLGAKQELDERKDILPFFRQHEQLCSAIAGAHGIYPDRIAFEYDLFGDFVVDLVIGSSTDDRYFFIEFEDAKSGSLFKRSNRANTIWGRGISSAFYQIVDWFWKLSDLSHTDDFEKRFGTRNPSITGVIVVGRNSSVSDIDRNRLKWMAGNVAIQSSNIFIYTFDDLLTLLVDKLKLFEIGKNKD